MIYPDLFQGPPPHEDMPEELKVDYLEALSIVNKSPRGAAALLRLVLQKLLIQLGGKGENMYKDIESFVKKGLPEEIQIALDTVRVIGNEAVHPGLLNLKDDRDTAMMLFELINFIVEEQIARKKDERRLSKNSPNRSGRKSNEPKKKRAIRPLCGLSAKQLGEKIGAVQTTIFAMTGPREPKKKRDGYRPALIVR